MSANHGVEQMNPFPGLRPFQESETHLFFGRESQVDAMVNKLATTHFLAVVGTSGSGKSSLVNCGLRPALSRGLMGQAGTAWRMVQFRPGNAPLQAMAKALAQDGVLFREEGAVGLTLEEMVDTTLRLSKLGLIDIYEQARLDADVNLLVVVDQFEELFRYQPLGDSGADHSTTGRDDATAFVNLLLEVVAQSAYPIYVVLTMRSDFLGDCAHFFGLPEAINDGQYLVPRLTRNERRAAISGPIAVGQATIAPVLLTRLVNDVGDNPDQLSILQHALNRTWSHWEQEAQGADKLDLEHYLAIGGMADALNQHADEAYAELDSERQQQICKIMFQALTDKGTDARGIRRPTLMRTLCELADASEAEVASVIEVFREPSRSFLMPPAGEPLEAETVVDISHESLMRVWKRLDDWAVEEAQAAGIYRRLAETAVLHERYADGQRQAGLYDDPELQVALKWRDDHQPPNALPAWARRYHEGFDQANEFLDKSRRERQERRREEERQRAEVRTAKQKAMRLSAAVAALLGGLVLVGWLAWDSYAQKKIAEQQQAIAENQKQIADTLRLAVQAESELAHRPAQGLLLAVESYFAGQQASETRLPASETALRKALANIQPIFVQSRTPLHPETPSVSAVAFDATGKWLATGIGERTVHLWDLDQPGVAPEELVIPVKGSAFQVQVQVSSVVFSPKGDRLAIVMSDGVAGLWDLTAQPAKWQAWPSKSRISIVAFSPQGRWLATVHERTVELQKGEERQGQSIWNVELRDANEPFSQPVVTLEHLSRVTDVAFSPGERPYLATVSEEEAVQIWDVANHQVKMLRQLDEVPVLKAVFAPEGMRLATINEDGTLWIWELESDGVEPYVLRQEFPVTSVSFSPPGEGQWLATGNEAEEVHIWKVNPRVLNQLEDEPVEILTHDAEVSAITFGSEGKRLATVTEEGKSWLWSFGFKPAEPQVLPRALAGETTALAAHTRWLARVSNVDSGIVRLWDLNDHPAAPRELLHKTAVVALAFNPASEWLVTAGEYTTGEDTAGEDQAIYLWNLEQPHDKPEQVLKGHKAPILSVAFGEQGQQLASADEHGTVWLWNLTTFEPVKKMMHEDAIVSVALRVDAESLATVDEDGSLWLWDLKLGASTPQELIADPPMQSAVFGPTGQWLSAVAKERDRVLLWNLATPQAEPRVLRHASSVQSVAFAPEGQQFVTASKDGTVRIWELGRPSGKPVILYGHVSPVLSVAFDVESKRLVTAGDNGVVRRWHLEPKRLVTLACRTAGRDLNEAELQDYLGQVEARSRCAGKL